MREEAAEKLLQLHLIGSVWTANARGHDLRSEPDVQAAAEEEEGGLVQDSGEGDEAYPPP